MQFCFDWEYKNTNESFFEPYLKLGQSTSIEEVKRLDKNGNLTRNLVDPLAKDSVTVPDGGYVILRFHADNPGKGFSIIIYGDFVSKLSVFSITSIP
jgi:hypothetical protein